MLINNTEGFVQRLNTLLISLLQGTITPEEKAELTGSIIFDAKVHHVDPTAVKSFIVKYEPTHNFVTDDYGHKVQARKPEHHVTDDYGHKAPTPHVFILAKQVAEVFHATISSHIGADEDSLQRASIKGMEVNFTLECVNLKSRILEIAKYQAEQKAQLGGLAA